jgi:hypothetical protein
MTKKKSHGHYCKVCGSYKPNEQFSGKGHKQHICKKCMQLPIEERKRRMNSFLDADDFIHDDLNMKRMPIVFFSEEWDEEESYSDVNTRDVASQLLDPFRDDDLPF